MRRRHRTHAWLSLAAGVVLGGAIPLPGQSKSTSDLITLNLKDEDVGNVLQVLATQHRLNLVAGDQARGKVTINLYDVPLDEALGQVLATQGLGFVKQGSFYRVMTLDERRAVLQDMDPIETRVFTLNHVTSAEAQQLLRSLLSADGSLSLVAEGSGGGAAPTGGGAGGAAISSTHASSSSSGQRQSIVVRDHASRIATVATTLHELDKAPQQVLLEATILAINLGETNRLGVDFNVIGGIDFSGTGTASDLTGFSPYSLTNGTLDRTLFSGKTIGFTNDPPSGGLSLGFVSNNVAAFVEALEQTTNATIVSNPRVIALNGHQAEIIVGGRLGYKTVIQNQTSTVEEVHFLDTGTQLVFRPFVGDDGWIRMEVHPQNSTGVIDPNSGVPSENTTEISTKILMRDGQTLILGGLIGETVQSIRNQIPVLGNLPLLGVLFGRTEETVSRSELVILLTPHILDPVEAQTKAEEARKRFESVHRSHWDSLSPYIRPVRAKGHFADAGVLRAQGQLQRALGSLECALTLDPTNADAAVLRDQVLEQMALNAFPISEQQSALTSLRSLASPTTSK